MAVICPRHVPVIFFCRFDMRCWLAVMRGKFNRALRPHFRKDSGEGSASMDAKHEHASQPCGAASSRDKVLW
jgi:hypothetical protein